MMNLLQQITAGLAAGSLYAALALALVMLYRASTLVNFAQGEMAMLCAYVGYFLLQAGVPYPVAFGLTLAVGWVMGAALYRLLIHPIGQQGAERATLVTMGLMMVINSLCGWAFGHMQRSMPSPVAASTLELAGATFDAGELAQGGIVAVLFVALFLFFRYTPTGLAIRAVAAAPAASALLGVRVERVLATAWGLAAALGAAAGMLAAPSLMLSPAMMSGTMIYGFAAATLGGFGSAGGAVLGGLLVGVGENLVGTYVPVIGTQFKFSVALAAIIAVLAVRPSGLLGRGRVVRV